MEILQKILAAFHLHDWYAVAALVLMVLVQVIRSNHIPVLTKLWFKVPDGYRWVGPILLGMATAFVNAFAGGMPLGQALVATVGGLLGIGVPAMGMHAVAKESPLHVDGGAGGSPLNSAVNPPS